MANGSGWGGARPGSGPKSGDPLRRALRIETDEQRAARDELVQKIIASNSNPLLVMAQIAGDRAEPSMIRLTAAARLAPYCYPMQPTEAHVAHTHTSADREALMQGLLARFAALATPVPTLDATPEPAPALPEAGAGD